MRRFWRAWIAVIAAALPSAAQAIRCDRAASAIERMICGDPRLLHVDAAMGRAYAAVLAAASDPAIRAMLVASQKRWIAARDTQFYTLRTVADVVGGNPRIKAACKDRGCFDAAGGWNISPATAERARYSKALATLDADVDDSDTDWLQACLTDRRFPVAGGR